MECFQQRARFLYKYKDRLDFVQLTQNRSVSDWLIQQTPDLPWCLDDCGTRLPIPVEHLSTISASHTDTDINEWNYIEACLNPYWTWDTMAPSVEKAMTEKCWNERYGRWFFHNWSRNNALMRISLDKVQDSLIKYIAATKIKRTFKKCITTPTHHFCQSRLLREFTSLSHE